MMLGLPGVVLAGNLGIDADSLFLTAASDPDDRHWLKVFRIAHDASLVPVFQHALPARGHHMAAHGQTGLYAAVARRPGNWLQFGSLDGRLVHQLDSPAGRHFLGHGVFSRDGKTFFTVENDYRDINGDSGRIAVWQVRRDQKTISVRRKGDFLSYGVGPHELMLMPDGHTLVIANGGIRTHPDNEREKLNLESMQPSLVYVDSASGRLLEKQQLPGRYHQASIRHLDVNSAGQVALVMQYEGLPFEDVPLVALHERGQPLKLPDIPLMQQQQMKQYCGSVRYDQSGRYLAVSCPRGNMITFWDARQARFTDSVRARDGCGVCALADGFLYTAGTGKVSWYDLQNRQTHDMNQVIDETILWDNHLTMVEF